MVGAGSIGRRHMASLRALVPSGLAFDVLREGRSRDVASLGDVSVSASLDEAMRKQPDLMVIANPSAMHTRFIVAAIEGAVPFYAEKPVVTSAADVALLRDTMRARQLPPHIVGCNLRFLASLVQLRGLVRDGALGRVVRASFEAGQWLPDWRPAQDYRESYSARRELGGGVLLDLIHEIDAARWMLGEFNVADVHVATNSDLEIDTEDCACVMLRSATGVLATVQLDYVSRKPFRRYRVVGDKASAEWDLPSKTLTLSDQRGVRTVTSDPADFDVPATYPAAMRDLLAAIAAGRPSSQPLEEGLRALDIVLKAPRSASAA
jgi:predicted dehydrogenase